MLSNETVFILKAAKANIVSVTMQVMLCIMCKWGKITLHYSIVTLQSKNENIKFAKLKMKMKASRLNVLGSFDKPIRVNLQLLLSKQYTYL